MITILLKINGEPFDRVLRIEPKEIEAHLSRPVRPADYVSVEILNEPVASHYEMQLPHYMIERDQ